MTQTAQRIKAFFVTLAELICMLVLLPQTVYFAIRISSMWEAYEGGKSEVFPAYVCLVALVFFAFSYTKIVVAYNRPLRECFWDRGAPVSFGERLRFVLTRPELWIKALIIGLFYGLMPLKWTLGAMAALTEELSAAHRLLSLAGLLLFIFFSAMLAHLSATKRWCREKDQSSYGKKKRERESGFVLVVYGMGTGMFIVTFPFIWPIIAVLISSLTVGRAIFIGVLLCLPLVFRTLRALRKRRSFLKRLDEVCAERGYTRSQVHKPYLSLFRFTEGESFTLSMGDKAYSCKLISARKKGVPLALSEDGTMSFIHTIRIRSIVLHQYTTTYDFDYESPLPKILIINPVPKLVCHVYAGKLIELDNGSSIGGYKLFAATGFLRAAELDVLHK